MIRFYLFLSVLSVLLMGGKCGTEPELKCTSDAQCSGATPKCNLQTGQCEALPPPPPAPKVDCDKDADCTGQTKNKCYKLAGQTDKGTCARPCTTDAYCGAPGTGAMCLKSQGAAATDEGICMQWEMNRKGEANSKVANWQAGQDHCAAKKKQTERWAVPTKAELKYLCRTKTPYEDSKVYSDDDKSDGACPSVDPTCSCPHARQVLGVDFDEWFFWSSTCYDSSQPNKEKESRLGDSACLGSAWDVGFDEGRVDNDFVADGSLRLRCVRPE